MLSFVGASWLFVELIGFLVLSVVHELKLNGTSMTRKKYENKRKAGKIVSDCASGVWWEYSI